MGVIVVATDGSPAASAALCEAIDIARETGDEIAVVTVWQALQGDFGVVFPPGAPLEALLDAERIHAEETLVEARDRVEDAGVTVETRLTAGSPAEMICRYADEVGARLIAMGSHGHGRMLTLLMGSVSASVLRQAGRPVLIVPFAGTRRRRNDQHFCAAN